MEASCVLPRWRGTWWPLPRRPNPGRRGMTSRNAWSASCSTGSFDGRTRSDRGGSASIERDAILVPREPLVERLQLGIQAAGKCRIPGAAERFLKVAFELEHVAQVVGAGETEAAVDLRRHVVVAHLPTERLRHCGRHLGAGQLLSRNGHGLPDELTPAFDQAVGALADI